jgi:hypothetical protein
MSQERFNELINLFLDKALDDEELLELRQAIHSDPALKESFIRRYQLHRALTASLVSANTPAEKHSATYGLFSFAAAGTALLALAGISLLLGLSYMFELQKNKADGAVEEHFGFLNYQPSNQNLNTRRLANARLRIQTETAIFLEACLPNQTPQKPQHVKVDNNILLSADTEEPMQLFEFWSSVMPQQQAAEINFLKAGFRSFQASLP